MGTFDVFSKNEVIFTPQEVKLMKESCSLYRLILLSVIALSFGCTSPKSNLESLDLLSYGLPLKIMAPPGSEVEFDDLGIIKDVTVKGGERFFVQIFASETNTLDPKVLISDLKTTIEAGPFFSKIMEEDEFGFIYEKKIDEEYINYDFRQVKIRGDQKYVFQTGLSGKYELDDIREMYKAVK